MMQQPATDRPEGGATAPGVWSDVRRALAGFFKDALDILLPEEQGCALCGRPGYGAMHEVFYAPICRGCLAAIAFVRDPYCHVCGRPMRGGATVGDARRGDVEPGRVAMGGATTGEGATVGVAAAGVTAGGTPAGDAAAEDGVTGGIAAGGSRVGNERDKRVPRLDTCHDCAAGGRFFKLARAVGVYDGALKDLVHAFKFHGRRELAEGLGVLMARVASRERAMRRAQLVVPVPLHPKRLAERGYNQAELLARMVGSCLGTPVRCALVRTIHTGEQNKLGGHTRRENLRGAFAVPYPLLVAGSRVMLVDDVMTTGATANECARALLRAGAVEVLVLAAAVTPLEKEWLTRSPG